MTVVGGVRSLAAPLALIASLIISVSGLLFMGWDWRELLIFYWLTNITVGATTLITVARSDFQLAGLAEEVNGRKIAVPSLSGASTRVVKFFAAAFFCVHYGIFTLVHGVFVFAIAGGAFAAQPDLSAVGPLEIGALVASWSLVLALTVVSKLLMPIRQQSIRETFTAPYKRIFVLHITLIIGAFAIQLLGLPTIAALLLIGFNTVIELKWWRDESRSTGAAPSYYRFIT